MVAAQREGALPGGRHANDALIPPRRRRRRRPLGVRRGSRRRDGTLLRVHGWRRSRGWGMTPGLRELVGEDLHLPLEFRYFGAGRDDFRVACFGRRGARGGEQRRRCQATCGDEQ